MPEKILWLRETFPWMGRHSGYDRLFNIMNLRAANPNHSVFRDRGRPLPNGSNALLRRLARCLSPSPFYDKHSLWTELQAIISTFSNKARLVHVSYVENNLGLIGRISHFIPVKIVGTVHQPVSWWQKHGLAAKVLNSLDALIVLSEKERIFFDQLLPGRVHLIPHGIDTEFFRPEPEAFGPAASNRMFRCVFAGVWLRDLDVLVDVINLVTAEETKIAFDLIIPQHLQNRGAFRRIERPHRIQWHAGLTDEQLREVYRDADLFVMPLIDCTANNALLEAMACGLPIVSNRIGGLPEYSDRSFAELLPVGDVRGMAAAILKLIKESAVEKRRAARAFAEDHFSWHRIVPQMESLYLNLLPSN